MSTTTSSKSHSRLKAASANHPRLVTWLSPAPSLWVLNHACNFRGTVDRNSSRFSPSNGHRRPLGDFATAQSALFNHTRATSQIGKTA